MTQGHPMRITTYNPVRPYIGAPLGALAGSVLATLAFSTITSLTGRDYDAAAAWDADDRRRAAGALTLMSAFGSAVGAYLGAAPHQRVAAAIGAALGAAGSGIAVIPSSAEQWRPHGWQTGPVRALLLYGAPTAGAAAGAAVSSAGAPASLPAAY